jgi:hypothetical protein
VLFPRALLPFRQDEAARLTSVAIPGDQGVAALISPLARRLPRYLNDCDPAEGARFG